MTTFYIFARCQASGDSTFVGPIDANDHQHAESLASVKWAREYRPGKYRMVASISKNGPGK